ncbi:MAG: hypothetical protein ABSB94_11920 [Syntrophorhabdales bacterium]|jgi:hypothetical protein
MEQFLSMREYAASHHATPQAATRWKKRGLLIFDGTLVVVSASNARLKKYRSAQRTAQPPEEDEISTKLLNLLVAALVADVELEGVTFGIEGETLTVVDADALREDYKRLKNEMKAKKPDAVSPDEI